MGYSVRGIVVVLLPCRYVPARNAGTLQGPLPLYIGCIIDLSISFRSRLHTIYSVDIVSKSILVRYPYQLYRYCLYHHHPLHPTACCLVPGALLRSPRRSAAQSPAVDVIIALYHSFHGGAARRKGGQNSCKTEEGNNQPPTSQVTRQRNVDQRI